MLFVALTSSFVFLKRVAPLRSLVRCLAGKSCIIHSSSNVCRFVLFCIHCCHARHCLQESIASSSQTGSWPRSSGKNDSNSGRPGVGGRTNGVPDPNLASRKEYEQLKSEMEKLRLEKEHQQQELMVSRKKVACGWRQVVCEHRVVSCASCCISKKIIILAFENHYSRVCWVLLVLPLRTFCTEQMFL